MLINYLKLSLRLMARNPVATLINISGLSVGFATFLLLWPYTESELKSDQFHNDADRIVRLGVDFKWTDDGLNWNGFLGAFNSWGVAHEVAKTFPDIEAVTRAVVQLNYSKERQGVDRDLYVTVINKGQDKETYREAKTIFADSNFFQFFSLPLLAGDKQTVLSDANSVVLSEATSKKYFGNEEAVGRTIYLNDSISVKVTGVFKNLPRNTHLKFDMVFSVKGKQGMDMAVWNGWAGYCYFKLNEDYDINAFQKDLNDRKEALYGFVKFGCPHCDWESLVQPLKEVVFSDLRGNTFHSKSKYLLEILYSVSFLVLILGWINYITLSIHQLNKRLTELAARRVIGAGVKELVVQFLVESFTINFIALVAAFTLFQLMQTPFERLLGLYVPDFSELELPTFIVLISVFFFGIFITAFYPLRVIRRKNIGDLFASKRNGVRHSSFNIGLITAQYASAIVLLIWIVTSNLQVNHILEKDIGLKKNGVVVVEGSPRIHQYDDSRISAFLSEARRIQGVNQATVSYSLVGEPDVKGLVIQRSESSNFVGVDTNGGVDENFLETFRIRLLAGRNFLPDNPADRQSILISHDLVKRLGFQSPEEALGQSIMLPEYNVNKASVIGVFSDYEFRPYFNDATEHNRGIALIYKDYMVPNFKPLKLSIALDMQSFKKTINDLEVVYKSLFPDETFKWYWLDERIASQYTNERTAKNQLGFFTLLAVMIACLGLFGLISNKAIEKTKEIGIRKVLGANLHQIALILLNTTLRQIIIAAIIGIPMAWYFTEQYLQKFSERIELYWWHFVSPVVLLISMMLATVATVVWKAARNNPVEALKYE